MKFSSLSIPGPKVIELEKKADPRGFFARYYCEKEFLEQGLETQWVQMNTTLTHKVGAIRGLHFQREPQTEAKIVRCLNGAIMDVIVDLRKGSDSYGRWISEELTSENRKMLYIPAGFAHGFQTLQEDTELLYMHSEFYSSEHEGGVLYSDPQLNIQWPMEISDISERDQSHPLLKEISPIIV